MSDTSVTKKVSRDAVKIIIPSAVIGVGLAAVPMVSLPAGIIIMGVGVAIAAFATACTGIDLNKVPASYKREPKL